MQPTKSNSDYKLIDWRLSDPASFTLFGSKNDKATFTQLLCSNSENCDAYKSGRCAMWNMFSQRCPYGRKQKEEGFTRRARKYRAWIDERKDRVKGVDQLGSQKKACRVGDYIYFPYPHWSLDRSVKVEKRAGLFSSHDEFINVDSFTVDFFNDIVNARPKTIFDNREIISYQRDVVPLMVQHMKEAFPDFCKEWEEKYPETAFKFKEPDYVGRRALLCTLKPGCEVITGKGKFVWDGEFARIDKYGFIIGFPIDGNFTCIRARPDKDVTVKVTDNSQVWEKTEFVD